MASGPWEMWAHEREGAFRSVGPLSYVRAHHCGGEVRPVKVEEDPAGPYWGWLWADRDAPSMIWFREASFRMCFAGMPEDMQERGEGRIVRLRIEPRPVSAC